LLRLKRDTVVVQPETRYTKAGDVSVAYQVVGEGPVDLVCVYGSHQSNIQVDWTDPSGLWPAWHRKLAAFSRLILFDPRGMGGSDRVATPGLEERMDDLRAVLDAVGSSRAALLGMSAGAWMPALFAATHPERTLALVLYAPLPRMTWAPDFPWGPTADAARRENDEAVARLGDFEWWREKVPLADLMSSVDWSKNEQFERWLHWRSQVSTSPGALAASLRIGIDTDVREVLPTIRVPTLVLQRVGDRFFRAEVSRYVADRIPTAVYVEQDDESHFPWAGDVDGLVSEIRRFLEDTVRESGRRAGETERVLVTVLFTDIVGATARAAELGDARWRALLAQHHALIRGQLARFRGKELDTAGDGFFASFDGPARAIRCACSIAAAVKELGLDVRAGLHTGECELVEGKVSGIAVHTGARVAAQADAGEVLVSSTVKDLVAGSGLNFQDRGIHTLKGVPGEWRLYGVREAI
jgi:class 3 adenylate cyclase/pimeloyl-ACP methyl ester carboxylesterase